ncbi:unnamed protein product [Arctia plantaginis]|uniref:Uncharacterized protein n=1 Tax=Arctia plantaginis TaxID=874455 RepID=A0A8S1AJ57_ARCPL|nr:unnamed protein product [Arctia plantaginis]
MRKENIQMKILRYGAPGAAAWKILRGGRVLLNDIFQHALLLLLTHGSDIGYVERAEITEIAVGFYINRSFESFGVESISMETKEKFFDELQE